MDETVEKVEFRHALPAGFELMEYRILEVLGSGGFGITYLAIDQNLNRKVVIKENLPLMYACRDRDSCAVGPITSNPGARIGFEWSVQNFEREAQTLAAFNHPHIVPVWRSFPAHGTAYFVMPYLEGEVLESEVSRMQRAKQSYPEERIDQLMLPLLSALEVLHENGIYHRDLKPSNVLLTGEDATPVLIDFGAARNPDTQSRLTVMLTEGYSPFEQSETQGNVGAWSDLYGLAATLYRCITFEVPPKANDRVSEDPIRKLTQDAALRERYRPSLLYVIDQALSFAAEDRPQSVTEWRLLLAEEQAGPVIVPRGEGVPEGSVSESSAPENETVALTDPGEGSNPDQARKPVAPVEPEGKARSKSWIGGAIVGVLSLGLLTAFLATRMGGSADSDQDTSPPLVKKPELPAERTETPEIVPKEPGPPSSARPQPGTPVRGHLPEEFWTQHWASYTSSDLSKWGASFEPSVRAHAIQERRKALALGDLQWAKLPSLGREARPDRQDPQVWHYELSYKRANERQIVSGHQTASVTVTFADGAPRIADYRVIHARGGEPQTQPVTLWQDLWQRYGSQNSKAWLELFPEGLRPRLTAQRAKSLQGSLFHREEVPQSLDALSPSAKPATWYFDVPYVGGNRDQLVRGTQRVEVTLAFDEEGEIVIRDGEIREAEPRIVESHTLWEDHWSSYLDVTSPNWKQTLSPRLWESVAEDLSDTWSGYPIRSAWMPRNRNVLKPDPQEEATWVYSYAYLLGNRDRVRQGRREVRAKLGFEEGRICLVQLQDWESERTDHLTYEGQVGTANALVWLTPLGDGEDPTEVSGGFVLEEEETGELNPYLHFLTGERHQGEMKLLRTAEGTEDAEVSLTVAEETAFGQRWQGEIHKPIDGEISTFGIGFGRIHPLAFAELLSDKERWSSAFAEVAPDWETPDGGTAEDLHAYVLELRKEWPLFRADIGEVMTTPLPESRLRYEFPLTIHRENDDSIETGNGRATLVFAIDPESRLGQLVECSTELEKKEYFKFRQDQGTAILGLRFVPNNGLEALYQATDADEWVALQGEANFGGFKRASLSRLAPLPDPVNDGPAPIVRIEQIKGIAKMSNKNQIRLTGSLITQEAQGSVARPVAFDAPRNPDFWKQANQHQ